MRVTVSFLRKYAGNSTSYHIYGVSDWIVSFIRIISEMCKKKRYKMRVLGTCTRARKAVILQRQTTLLFYTGQFNTLII